MKNILLICFFALASIGVAAQANYTGVYGYSVEPGQNQHNNEKDATGPSGSLVLQKMDGNKYRFWLDVNIGAPSYNLGETDGTLNFVNDTASWDNTYEGAVNSCVLRFKITGAGVVISTTGNSADCGFGNRVNAAGTYTRLKDQSPLTNAWLKTQYHESAMMTVSSAKAELFQDENALRPFDKKQYIVKGERLLSIAENEKTVYTEYYDKSGKFIYGWLNKSDLSFK